MKNEFNIKARVTHIALHVQDIGRSATFYKRWCGMTEADRRVSDRTGETVVWMACAGQEDDFVIVLLEGAKRAEKPEGMRHIGLAVGSKQDVRRIADEAKAAGILHWDYVEMEPPVGTLCSITDPDGNIVEFSFGQPLGPDFRAQKQQEVKPQP